MPRSIGNFKLILIIVSESYDITILPGKLIILLVVRPRNINIIPNQMIFFVISVTVDFPKR